MLLEQPDTQSDEEADGFDYTAAPFADDETLDLEAAVRAAEFAAYWQHRITEISDLYDAEYQKLTKRMDALEERRAFEVGKLTKKFAFHQARITEYHRRLLLENPKRKTIDLVHGTSKATVPSKPQVWADPVATADLLAWVKEQHPEILRGPNITDIRTVVAVDDGGKVVDRKTGEVVPGLVAQVPAPRWSFEADPASPW